MMTTNLPTTLTPILARYMMSIIGAFVAIVRPTFPFVFVCTIAILADCYTAWSLGRRVRLKYPDSSDGKFRSSSARRVFNTLIKVYALILLVHLIDVVVVPELALHLTQIVAGAVCFWQIWSILENESSCNDNRWAKIVQRVMIDKTERHFNIDLHELKEPNVITKDGVSCGNVYCCFRGGESCDPPKCEMYIKPKDDSHG